MAGDRTRAVQELIERRKNYVDNLLANYYELSENCNRAALHLQVTTRRIFSGYCIINSDF